MQKNVLKKSFISHRFDILLGAALLIVALCLFLLLRNTKKNGGMIEVKQNNKLIGTYPLSQDASYEFKYFGGTNILVIKDGEAYMSESSCGDHICENMGKISKLGETIICLPNSLFVKVIEGEEAEYDAIAR